LVTGGQIISGRNCKNSIGSTSLAEGIVCLVGVLLYAIFAYSMTYVLVLPLVIGAVMSTPIAAITVKKLPTGKLKQVVGIIVVVLGVFTIIRVIL